MSPSTSTPQDAFKAPRPGWWTCHLCNPPVRERGGMDALHAHYMLRHFVPPEAKP